MSVQTGREKWPPRTWPLWVFWAGLMLGAIYWALGLTATLIAAGVIVVLGFLLANDLLG